MKQVRAPRELLTVIAIVITAFIVAASATWDYQLGSSRPTLISINERLVSFGRPAFIVSYKINNRDLLRFNSAVGNAAYMASICRSSSTTNRYGWERWKSEIFESVSASSPNTQIQIVFRRRDGFAIREKETVFCGPLVDSSDTKLFNPPTTVIDPNRFMFTFEVATAPPTLSMTGSNGNGGALPPGTPTETDIRRNGLVLTLAYRNDVWNTDNLDAIFAAFTCSPGNCLQGILRREHINITTAEPHILRINLDRVAIAMFNINQRSVIAFTPTTQTSYKGVMPENRLESFQFNVFSLSASPTVAIMNFVNGAYVDLPESEFLNITEKCIRGRDSSCQRMIVINKIAGEGNFQPETGADLAVTNALSGSANFMAIRDGWITSLVVDPRNEFSLQIRFGAAPSFEIWEPEIITFSLPGAVFRQLEPPANGPFRFRLLPSGGTVSWAPGEINEAMIWDGGFSVNITIDGDTWNRDEVRRSIVRDSYGVSTNPSSDGWNALKMSIIPEWAITFPTNNTVNLAFQQELLFGITVDESVTFVITGAMTRSGLAVEVGDKLSFTLEERPGRGVMNPLRDFDERDVWNGSIAFNFTLTGENWVDEGAQFDKCVEDLVAAMETNMPAQQGFAIAANRAQFLTSPAFSRVNRRNVVFRATAVPMSMYDVEKGETITLKNHRIPSTCVASGQSPETNFRIRIIPQNALISVMWLSNAGVRLDTKVQYRAPFDPNATTTGGPPPTMEVVGISETRLRRGGLKLAIVASLDYFSGVTAAAVYDGLVSDGVEATGWNERKRFITKPANVDVSNRSQIVVSFPDLYAPLDVSVDELVTLILRPSWMLSERAPVSNAQFAVYVAPGIAELTTWTGAHREVTEDDVRAGVITFTFALLGDSWMQQRRPYVESIVPLRTTPRGMSAVRDAILPGVDFFNFNYSNGIETMVMKFQAVPGYDIARDELIKIEFGNGTVASKLSPTVVNMTGQAGFTFVVRVTRGRVVLSGVVRNVQEKYIRQGRVTVYLTLFGETFAAGSEARLQRAVLGTDRSPTGFEALRTSILPLSAVNATATFARLQFVATRQFNIEREQLVFNLSSAMFESGLIPYSIEPLVIDIGSSGGELSFTLDGASESNQLTELDLRRDGVRLRLRLDGDTWNELAITRQPYTFLSGFSASAPVLTEPKGFNANFYLWTPNYTFVDRSTVIITLCGNCSGVDYDISEDEQVTFAVANTLFVESDLPEPSAVTFSVKMIPRVIRLIFDEPSVLWPEGRVTIPRFTSELASLLSVPSRRIVATLTRSDVVAISMYFSNPLTGDPTASVDDQADVRSSTELSAMLLGLNASFSFSKLFVTKMFYEDSPPDSTNSGGTVTEAPPNGPGSDENVLDGPYGTLIWAGGVTVFLGGIGVFMLCTSMMKRAAMPGALRTGSDPSSHKRKAGHSSTGPQFDVGDDTYGFAQPIDPLKVYAGQGANFGSVDARQNPLGLVDVHITSLKEHVRRRLESEQAAAENQERLGLPRRRIVVPKKTVFVGLDE